MQHGGMEPKAHKTIENFKYFDIIIYFMCVYMDFTHLRED